MKTNNTVSYIFPVHNEAKYLQKQILIFICQILENKLPLDEIQLVENGSSDESWKICQKLNQKYSFIKLKRINVASYGLAVKHALLSSNANTLVLLNVDFFDIHFISKALNLSSNFDVIIGSKLHKNSNDDRSSLTKLRTIILSTILKNIYKYPGTDTHGIKVFKNSNRLKKIVDNTICKNELFDTEVLLNLKNSIIELPVKLNEIRPTRYSSFNRIKRLAIDLFRLTSYKLFAKNEIKNIHNKVADDYGMNHIISNAILDLYKSKSVNIISVLPNMIDQNEIDLLKRFVNNNDIAIHINLVRGNPITNINQIPSLVSNTGKFYSLPIFLLRLSLKKISLREVETEIENQMMFLNNKMIKFKHINSEQHTHTFSPINEIVLRLSKKYSIINIRNDISIELNLSAKIHKYIILIFFKELLKIIYKNNFVNKSQTLEIISHPGSNYD